MTPKVNSIRVWLGNHNAQYFLAVADDGNDDLGTKWWHQNQLGFLNIMHYKFSSEYLSVDW